MTQTQEHHSPRFSLTSNAAGGPLPIIPRRSHSASTSCPSKHPGSLLSASSPSTYESTMRPSTSVITITPATPPKDDAQNPSIHGTRRRRDERIPNPNALYPPELSTPIPSLNASTSFTTTSTPSPFSKNSDATPRASNGPRSPMLYTPGMPLRFSIDSLRKASSRNASVGFPLHTSNSASPVPSTSVYSVGSSQGSPSLIRKKSGQVVRPSLKPSSSYSFSHSGPSSPIPSFPSSKSEPSTPTGCVTPTSKAVHFDKNLEQVKLFLAGQKPLAVSREGSPVDTDEGETCTSGTDSEFPKAKSSPSTIDGDNQLSTKLVMHTNIPPRSTPFPPSGTNVALELLAISSNEKNIVGSVLVRNVAFEKQVSVRFSLDRWSTISEVGAKWEAGVSIGRQGKAEWDRFGFVIWLGDLLLAEEKEKDRRLEFAVRYRVSGSEIWDNNEGENYIATFSKSKLPEERGRGRRNPPRRKASPVPFSDDELSDLLEKVAASKSSRKSRSISPTTPTVKGKSKGPQNSITTTPCPPGAFHTRTRSFPLSASSSSSDSLVNAYGWMEGSPSPSPPLPKWPLEGLAGAYGEKLSPIDTHKEVVTTATTMLGSSGVLGDDTFHPHPFIKFSGHSDNEERLQHSRLGEKTRRHRREGYSGSFAERTSSGKKIPEPTDTPSSTPTPTSSSKFHSFPFGMSLVNSHGVQEEEWPLRDSNPADQSAATIASTTPALSGEVEESSSSTPVLLENETPPSSRSSTPPLDPERDIGLLSPSNAEGVETYSDLLNKYD